MAMRKSFSKNVFFKTRASYSRLVRMALGIAFSLISASSMAQVHLDIAKEKPDLSHPETIEFPPMDPYVLYYVPEAPEGALNVTTPKECEENHGKWQIYEMKKSFQRVGCVIGNQPQGLFYDIPLRSVAKFADKSHAIGFTWFKDGKIEGYAVSLFAPKESVRLLKHYKSGVLDGPSFEWTEAGSLLSATNYKSGVLDGRFERYQECLPTLLGQYEDGVPTGTWQRYIEPGMISSQVFYDKPAPAELNLPKNAYWAEWFNGQGIKILEGYSVLNDPDDEDMFYVGDVQLYSTNGVPWLKVKYNAKGQNVDEDTFALCKKSDSPDEPIPAYVSYVHDELAIYCKNAKRKTTQKIFYYPTGKLWRIEPLDDEGRVSGKVREFHPTGEPLADYEMRDGVPIENVTYWNADGSIMHSSEFNLGNGTFEARWYNGKSRVQGEFRAGMREGRWKTWFESGNLESEIDYVHGEQSGVSRSWFSNGVIAHETHYRNGILDGDFINYYTDGRIAGKAQYEKNHPVGTQTFYLHSGGIEYENLYAPSTTVQTRYYSNGAKRASGAVLSGFGVGTPLGIWKYYLKDGTNWLTLEYDFGEIINDDATACAEMGGSYKLDDENRQMGCSICSVNRSAPLHPKSYREGSWKWWNENGQLETIGAFHLGKLDGKWMYYYPNGTLMLKGAYVIDKKAGEWTGFYEDGSKKFAGKYENGVETGKWDTFYKGKDVASSSGTFEDGKREGNWVYRYESGNIRETGTMKNGKETGIWVQFYEDGTKLGEGAFSDGKREGAWTWWRNDGKIWRSATYRAGKESQKTQHDAKIPQ